MDGVKMGVQLRWAGAGRGLSRNWGLGNADEAGLSEILLLLRNTDDSPNKPRQIAEPSPENHRCHPLSEVRQCNCRAGWGFLVMVRFTHPTAHSAVPCRY